MPSLSQLDPTLKPPAKALELAKGTIVQLIGAVLARAEGAAAHGAPQGGAGLVLPGTDLRLSAEDLAHRMADVGAEAGVALARPAAALLSFGAGWGLSGRVVLSALAALEELSFRAPDRHADDLAAIGRECLARAAGEAVNIALTGGTLEVPEDFGKTWSYQAQAKPASEATLWSSFHRQAEAILPREQIAPLFERLMTLEDLAQCATLLHMAEVSGLHRPQPSKVVFAPKDLQDTPETTWVP